jgi:hypothetical protein
LDLVGHLEGIILGASMFEHDIFAVVEIQCVSPISGAGKYVNAP